eukprot:TRINITY_DN14784_c0_g2_i2.p1 TRINITY_DN14784_c0_g2~~TRINITY_DN14784_c0_g2_i2.p1  ORF type:complete len:149 (+),score=15.64 TRINITY_DN14784_c0_g2_i2:249-695(+)
MPHTPEDLIVGMYQTMKNSQAWQRWPPLVAWMFKARSFELSVWHTPFQKVLKYRSRVMFTELRAIKVLERLLEEGTRDASAHVVQQPAASDVPVRRRGWPCVRNHEVSSPKVCECASNASDTSTCASSCGSANQSNAVHLDDDSVVHI